MKTALTDTVKALDSVNFRNEMWYLKLYSRFHNRLMAVEIDPAGRAKVVFSNGRELFTTEQQLESVEFLALCCMVYDL